MGSKTQDLDIPSLAIRVRLQSRRQKPRRPQKKVLEPCGTAPKPRHQTIRTMEPTSPNAVKLELKAPETFKKILKGEKRTMDV
jgi:hypothetical protein